MPEFNPAESENQRLFEKLITDFIQAIETDSRPFVDGESAKAATELVMAIYEEAGEPIKTFSE